MPKQGDGTLRATASSGALAAWAVAGRVRRRRTRAWPPAGGQARWMPLRAGARLRTGIQIEDTGGTRIILAGFRCSPSAS
jgi:hypothetical protein